MLKENPDEKYEYVVYDLNRIGNFLSDYRTEKAKEVEDSVMKMRIC